MLGVIQFISKLPGWSMKGEIRQFCAVSDYCFFFPVWVSDSLFQYESHTGAEGQGLNELLIFTFLPSPTVRLKHK